MSSFDIIYISVVTLGFYIKNSATTRNNMKTNTSYIQGWSQDFSRGEGRDFLVTKLFQKFGTKLKKKYNTIILKKSREAQFYMNRVQSARKIFVPPKQICPPIIFLGGFSSFFCPFLYQLHQY